MNQKSSETRLIGAPKSLAWMLIIGGIVGWAAAFVLTLERINVAANPDAVLSCDINPFISCKSVMLTWQAKLFGFPNPLIGIAAFMAPIVVGFALLSGAKFARWFWQLFTIGMGLGFIFVLWLFDQAVFDIGVLCPYCMVAWAGMIPMFWQVALYGASEGVIPVPIKSVNFFVAAYDWHWLVSLVTALGILIAIIWRFWDLWPTAF
ncbi:MAG: vitamin K epoxide reductase family protein [Actinomycetota bacterium]